MIAGENVKIGEMVYVDSDGLIVGSTLPYPTPDDDLSGI